MRCNDGLHFSARTRALVALAAALLFSTSAAPGRTANAGGRLNAWTIPHVLTISDGGNLDTLNPHLSTFATTANLSEMTMAWLVRWDEHNQPYPELATVVPSKSNGGVSADGRTITYHLRKGVRWSDGAPFDADDVAFSVAAVNNPANNEAVRFDQIAGVDEPDKYTVVFHLKAPYSPATASFFSSCCANPSLLPKHLLGRLPDINTAPYNERPVGIGPFKFERWDRGKAVELVADPLYWRGRPKLDRVVYKIVAGRSAVMDELEGHAIDMWYQFDGSYLDRIAALPGYSIVRQPSYAYNHLDFNLTHPAVADPIVRRALRLALNRRRIVDEIEHGAGIVQDSALPVSAPYFSDIATTPYDPAQANALLDGAGWTRGADGIRTKNGVRLNLTVAIRDGSADAERQLARIGEDWQKAGVALDIHRYPVTKMFAPVQQGGIVFGDSWDIVAFVWAADPLGDYSGIYGCDSFPPAGQNNVRWCNRAAKTAMDALFTHYDPAERTADVKAVMQQFVTDVPSIVSFLRVDLFAYNRDLKNYRPNTLTPFDNMMDVDI